MTISKSNQLFIGAWLWVASLQYYVVQLLVAHAWTASQPFSWLNNTISDLGNTACGAYGQRQVCSPFHPVMNASFIILGITMSIGAWLLMPALANSTWSRLAFLSFLPAGVGTILVGLFPENTISALHILGAALPFTLGNLAMIIIGIMLAELPQWLRTTSVLLGVLALAALVVLLSGRTLGIGGGGVERLVAYPQSIWMILFGLFILLSGAHNSCSPDITLER